MFPYSHINVTKHFLWERGLVVVICVLTKPAFKQINKKSHEGHQLPCLLSIWWLTIRKLLEERKKNWENRMAIKLYFYWRLLMSVVISFVLENHLTIANFAEQNRWLSRIDRKNPFRNFPETTEFNTQTRTLLKLKYRFSF